MQRPSVCEGMVVALVISLIASPLGSMVSLWRGGAMGGKLCLVALTYIYIVYLLVQSPKHTGRTLLAVLSALVLLGSALLETRWVVLVAMALIAGIRACAYSRSLLPGLLHGGLCLLGLGAALWAYRHSGSLMLAVWSFFLLQALFVWIPLCLRSPAAITPGEVGEGDGFIKAHQAAQQALARLRARPLA